MHPGFESIQADLGDAYAWSGAAPGKAADHYRTALSLSRASLQVNPRDLDSLMVAAYCAAALGEKQEALRSLNEAMQHAPEDAEVNYYAARVYARLGNAPAAREALQTAIAQGYSRADIDTAPDLARIANELPAQ